jgi:hypothetical protein
MTIDDIWANDDKPTEFSGKDKISSNLEDFKKLTEVKQEEIYFLAGEYKDEVEEISPAELRIKLRTMRFDNI